MTTDTLPGTVPAAPLTARDMEAMLRRHYLPDGRPPGGIFAAEIQCPAGKRRADALWMPTSWTGADRLIGHEIKVSRADVLAELADPTKADAWAMYCDQWWLVVADPALVAGLDVPSQWGVMARPSGRRTRTMTVVRPAPSLSPVAQAPAYRRLAAWTFQRERERAAVAEADARAVRDRLDQHMKWSQSAEFKRAGAGPEVQRAAEIVRQAQALKTSEGLWGTVADGDIVRAVVDIAHARAAAQDLARHVDRLVSELERATASSQFTDIRAHLGRIAKEAKVDPS